MRIGIPNARALLTIAHCSSLAHQGFSYHFWPGRNAQRDRAFLLTSGAAVLMGAGTPSDTTRCIPMTKESLQHQAERAEALAAQTIDDELKQTLLKAAREYREQLKAEEFEAKAERKHPKDIS